MTSAEGHNRYRQIIEDAVAEAVTRKAACEIAGQKERRFSVSEVKWVIVERQNMSGRYVALPGVSYPTQAEAEAHIKEKFDPRYHDFPYASLTMAEVRLATGGGGTAPTGGSPATGPAASGGSGYRVSTGAAR